MLIETEYCQIFQKFDVLYIQIWVWVSLVFVLLRQLTKSSQKLVPSVNIKGYENDMKANSDGEGHVNFGFESGNKGNECALVSEKIVEAENGPENHLQPTRTEYVMYKRRWLGMLAIVLLNLTTGLVWLSFTSVPEISENWLNTGLTNVNLSAILYFIGSIVSSPFSGFVFEKYGIKKALLIGAVINCIGVWIRYAASFIESSNKSFELRLIVVLVGQFIAALSQPFFLNAPPKFAAVWFSDSSRAVAITIGTLSNPISAAIAFIVVPTISTKESGEDMPLLLLIIAISGVVALASVLFMSTEPPTPPSPSAAIALAEASEEPFWISLKKTSSNRQFWILWIAFSVFAALFNTLSSLITQIVKPYGYTDDDAGIFGASLIGAGVVGAGISGVILDKYKIYKPVMRICCPLLAVGYVGFLFLVQKDGFVGIALICAVLGLFAFALLPAALELGIECTYPCPPSSSTSLLWMGAQLFAVVFLSVGDALRDETGDPPDNMHTALIVTAGLACVTVITVFLFNSPYYRMEAEIREREESENRTLAATERSTIGVI